MCIYWEIQKLQMVAYSYPRIESDYDGFKLRCSVVPQREIGTRQQQGIQIVTPIME